MEKPKGYMMCWWNEDSMFPSLEPNVPQFAPLKILGVAWPGS
jgi:hypothetical protein